MNASPKASRAPSRSVDVLNSGAVCLGDKIVCDGFAKDRPIRVQTHVHDDHMSDFTKSKGLQDFYLSVETYDLLVAEFNWDIEYRENFFAISRGQERILEDGTSLSLIPSNHMLGASQVLVELVDGRKLGYSGDFGWPLNQVIEVDELVVDATYGNRLSVRRYSQHEAEKCLTEIVKTRLRQGSIHIRAHRGTIERVLHVLGDDIGVPILASSRLIDTVNVYQKYGFAVGELTALDSEAGRHAVKHRAYVRLYSKGDGFENELIEGTTIVCSAYMPRNSDSPLLQYSDRAYRVALSNHADFNETLAYIEATGAQVVVTDNTRNYGIDLANAITHDLGVFSVPSSNYSPRE